MLKKVLKKSIVCCLLVCLLVCMTVVTAAAETEMGTVNIKFPSSAKGITMVAYEIGYYAEGEYIVNENFSGSDVSLEGIELADASEVQRISQTLMDYAENQGYEGKEVQVDVNGNVSVQLPATDKIYVMGQKDGKGIMQILSFLALLPYYTADGRQTVVDATSKVSLSSNFEYNKGDVLLNKVDNSGKALQGAVFNLEFQIAYKLQDINYQVDRLIAYRNQLVQMMTEKVKELNRENFAVRQHIKYVDLYSSESNYQALTYEDTLLVREELAPLILPDSDEASAVRFDALMYGLELAQLAGKKYGRLKSDLFDKVGGIATVANIPEIQVQKELIEKILNTDYVERAGIEDFEHIRDSLRNLMKYLPHRKVRYDTDFSDDILDTQWNESELENDELKNYKAKAEYYIRQHQDNIVIAKLRTNQPLTHFDVESLEEILWKEVGTKEDYEQEYGQKPLGEFVRSIVGLDMNAAKEAFSEFLDNTNLDSRQIYFVNQIVEYIVHNGMMTDLSVLQESPFTDQGSVVDIFDFTVWSAISKVIEGINANAVA